MKKRFLGICLAAAMAFTIFPAANLQAVSGGSETVNITGHDQLESFTISNGANAGEFKIKFTTKATDNFVAFSVVAEDAYGDDHEGLGSSKPGPGSNMVADNETGIYTFQTVNTKAPTGASETNEATFTVPATQDCDESCGASAGNNKLGYTQAGGIKLYVLARTDNSKNWYDCGTVTIPQTGKLPVTKADPTDPAAITGVKYKHGLKLSDVTIPKTDSNKVTWSWTTGTTPLTVGTNSHAATSAETDDYNAGSANVSVEVVKGEMQVQAISKEVLDGTKLNTIDLNNGDTKITVKDKNNNTYTIPGTATWKAADPSNTTITAGTQAFTFVPTDTTNYPASIDGNYTFTIKAKQAMVVTLGKTTAVYTGSDLTPTVTVKAGGTTLVKDTDYAVAWTDKNNNPVTNIINVADGPYKCTITSLKNAEYTAPAAPATFTVTKATAKFEATGDLAYAPGEAATKTVTVSVVDAAGTAIDAAKYTVKYGTSATLPDTAGNHAVSVTITDPGLLANYEATAAPKNGTGYNIAVSGGQVITVDDLDFTNIKITKPYDGTTDKGTLTGTVTYTKDGKTVNVIVEAGAYDDKDASNTATATVALKLSDADMANFTLSAASKKLTGAEGGPEISITPIAPTGTPAFAKINAKDKKLTDVTDGLNINEIFTGIDDANGDGTPDFVAGTLKWYAADDAANATELVPGDTTVEQGKAYKWVFTPTSGNYTAVEGSYTPYKKSGGRRPSGGSSSSYVVTYTAGKGGSLLDADDKAVSSIKEDVSEGAKPSNIPEVKADEDYKFLGWSADGGKTFVRPNREEVNSSITYTAIFIKPDHIHYMIGYPEGDFRPNGNLTRAEAATMLSRLTAGFNEDGNYDAASFKDATGWSAKYISFAEDHNLVLGYEDNTFRPDNSITRAEFAALVARFTSKSADASENTFADVNGHWGAGYIAALVKAGIVDGYEDGSFRPNQTITRAEAAKIVNGALNRTPDEEVDIEALGYTNEFDDVRESNWFFHNVMEATNDHLAEHFHK